MSDRPHFGARLWQGEWPYPRNEGVGIHVTGRPRDESLCRLIFMQYGCPADIAWRHCDHLRAHGDLKTTVLWINFDALRQHLEQVGCALAIIPPKGYKAP